MDAVTAAGAVTAAATGVRTIARVAGIFVAGAVETAVLMTFAVM